MHCTCRFCTAFGKTSIEDVVALKLGNLYRHCKLMAGLNFLHLQLHTDAATHAIAMYNIIHHAYRTPSAHHHNNYYRYHNDQLTQQPPRPAAYIIIMMQCIPWHKQKQPGNYNLVWPSSLKDLAIAACGLQACTVIALNDTAHAHVCTLIKLGHSTYNYSSSLTEPTCPFAFQKGHTCTFMVIFTLCNKCGSIRSTDLEQACTMHASCIILCMHA